MIDRLSQSGAEQKCEVVIVDMQIPILDGYTAARILLERNCYLPLIGLTANAMDSDWQKCLDAGCDDFVTKPIHRQTLLNTVKTWAAQVNRTTATSTN